MEMIQQAALTDAFPYNGWATRMRLKSRHAGIPGNWRRLCGTRAPLTSGG